MPILSISRLFSTKPSSGNFPFYVYNSDRSQFIGIIYYQKDIKEIMGISETTFRRYLDTSSNIYFGEYKDFYYTQKPIDINKNSSLSLRESWDSFDKNPPVISGSKKGKLPYFVQNSNCTKFISIILNSADIKTVLGISNTYLLKRFESSEDGISIYYKDFFFSRH